VETEPNLFGELDQNIPYGTVYDSSGETPYKYEQDGRYYDGTGREVHMNGDFVTPKEKIDRARVQLDRMQKKKEALIALEIRKIEKEAERLEAEARMLYVSEAAKNIDQLPGDINEYKELKEIKMALGILEYPFDEKAKLEELEPILVQIFELAYA